MKPFDPRLLTYARTTRTFLTASVLLGTAGAGLVVAQATLLAEIVVRAFQQHASVADLTVPLLLLAATAAGRATVAWLTELAAHRACAAVKSQLRRRLLDHATALDSGGVRTHGTGELATLASRGLDALDDYFARYLPQLALAVIVPAVVLLRILGADWLSAAIIAGTLPLIPLFMERDSDPVPPSDPVLPADAGPPEPARTRPGLPGAHHNHAPLRRIRELTRAANPRGRFALAALLGSLALGCAVALMATSGWLISRASQQPPVLHLMVAVTAVRAFGIGRSVFRYAERLVSHDAVLRVLGALRTAVYSRLERLAPAGLHAPGGFRRGDLLSRLVADADSIQDWYLRSRLPAATAVTVSAAASLAMALLLPAAGAVLAGGLLLAGAAVPALSAALAQHAEGRTAAARGTLSTTIVDVLTATDQLSAAGALPRRLAAVRAADRDLTRLAARSAATAGIGSGLIALLTGLTVTVCAAVGIQAVSSGALSGVSLAVVVLTPLAAFEAVAGMPAAAQARRRSRAAAARLTEVLDTPEPVREPEHPADPPAQPLPITVRGLRARWPGQQAYTLDGIDLDLAPGRRIAVVGPSGSGKTTLAHVLLRFLDPADGTVTLGSGPQAVDTTRLDGDDVRRAIGLCAQDAHLFDSSLRENLRLARPAADTTELRHALAAVRRLDWADSLPDGLDTMVGEHGARLSGGQRQRLALARALLADFPALILDEPAEHLDLPTADALTGDLLAATAGRTTLLITHRLAGLARAGVDEILVLDHGRIVQRGGWRQLLGQDGPLRRMWTREQQADRLLTTV